jgi:hypothetical protein
MEIANYMHIELGDGHATAAISISNQREDGEGPEVAYVGMSFCSPKDQFCKKTGRMIAAGRLEKEKYLYDIVLDPDKQVSVQVREAIEESVESRDARFPGWGHYPAHVG